MSDATIDASTTQQAFDDAIHQLVNSIRRPKQDEAVEQVQSLLEQLTKLAGTSNSRWKTLLLALVHKRYHILSPQAQEEAGDSKQHVAAGDGERRIFYMGVRSLMNQILSSQDDGQQETLVLALGVLLQCAPYAGGSRDVCALLVEIVESILVHDDTIKSKRRDMMSLDGKESMSDLVSVGVLQVLSNMQGLAAFRDLLQLAADTLDKDFDILEHKKEDPTFQELPSTLHIFLPHRDRGRPKKRKRDEDKEDKVPDRQLVNSIVEILIWSRTVKALGNEAFVQSYERFIGAAATHEALKRNLQVMQTIIRNYRKELNEYAREQGFMLSTEFELDESKLSLKKIKRAKTGDLTNLTRLARKKQAQRVLKMIHFRFASDPSKSTKYGSIRELLRDTVQAPDTEDEVATMERNIHVARVKATVKYLRSLVKDLNKSVVVASMENADANHTVAALTAAAMSTWPLDEETGAIPVRESPKLLIAGVERAMSSFEDLVNLLDTISLGIKNESDAPTFLDESGTATTKAVINLTDRHLESDAILLLITTAHVSLPGDVMAKLISNGCSVHCHDADDIGERLNREKAQQGDITISLAWDSYDDLDLHVIVPGGEEISYANKNSNDGLCNLDVDMNAGGHDSQEPVENVFLGRLDDMVQAPLGKYKVFVQNYAYHSRGATSKTEIPFRVIVEKNGAKEMFTGVCVGSGSRSDSLVCEFEYTGRTVPFPRQEADKMAFGTSNLVNLTASTGQTLESIGQLVQTAQQHEHLDVVRTLVEEDDNAEIEARPFVDAHHADEVLVEDASTEARPLVAESGTLEVTNRDRTNILLAKLPMRFHLIVGDAFGGPLLAEQCADEIARRMVAEKIALVELKRHGYPDDIVAAVKTKMATSDVQ